MAQNFEFHFFFFFFGGGGGQQNEYFFGMMNFWSCFGGHHKTDLFLGVITIHFRAFSRYIIGIFFLCC